MLNVDSMLSFLNPTEFLGKRPLEGPFDWFRIPLLKLCSGCGEDRVLFCFSCFCFTAEQQIMYPVLPVVLHTRLGTSHMLL